LLALLLPVTSRPVLAPITAMLVAQVTLYQTVGNAARRVASVLSGVLVPGVAIAALSGAALKRCDLRFCVPSEQLAP
jgi:hypothetical protein